jgi:hypothetical protein
MSISAMDLVSELCFEVIQDLPVQLSSRKQFCTSHLNKLYISFEVQPEIGTLDYELLFYLCSRKKKSLHSPAVYNEG